MFFRLIENSYVFLPIMIVGIIGFGLAAMAEKDLKARIKVERLGCETMENVHLDKAK